jgi:hypothetical protein
MKEKMKTQTRNKKNYRLKLNNLENKPKNNRIR